MDKQYIGCTRGCFNPTGELGDKEAKSLTDSNKLNTNNWLEGMPPANSETDLVEVRFKNTRKGYYKNVNKLRLRKGDIVAVEASPGHDIGIVGLTGDLVLTHMKRNNVNFSNEEEIKKIYRKAKGIDIEKWYQAIEQEMPVMLKARQLSAKLNLDMKIGDVEFQGDKTKAIFYYIADDRVDFRELIKIYAEEFRVRIEMKQIGARQEAGRIGGIGSCGRELCCSSWLTNFVSVTTNSARYQEVSLNPQKLAGQCGKLKCCLNYELKCYLDAQEDFPDVTVPLELMDSTAYHLKTDVYRRIMWYSYSKDESINLIPVSVDQVKEIVELNKKGIKAKDLTAHVEESDVAKPLGYQSPVGADSISRFEESSKSSRKKKKKFRSNNNQNGNAAQSDAPKQNVVNKVQPNNQRQPQSNSQNRKPGFNHRRHKNSNRPGNEETPA